MRGRSPLEDLLASLSSLFSLEVSLPLLPLLLPLL
jgi:hypothetical protein